MCSACALDDYAGVEIYIVGYSGHLLLQECDVIKEKEAEYFLKKWSTVKIHIL